MLFVTTYRPRGPMSEAEEKRLLQLFASYQVPSGIEVKGWWVRADNTAVIVSETDSSEKLMEALAAWQHAYEYNVQPAVEIATFARQGAAAAAWRDSVK